MIRDRSLLATAFNVGNYATMGVLALLCVLPMVNVLAVSLSDSAAASANRVVFFPIGFNMENYRYIIETTHYFRAFGVSVLRVVAGVTLNMTMTMLTAYPLARSRRELKGRNALMWIFVFPMLFSGGLIPLFLVLNRLGLINTFWVLILPTALPLWNTVLMVNFFRGVPKALEESALMDGASYVTILFQIFLPLSTAGVATLSLFAAVMHWNSWFDGMIFISNDQLRPLQSNMMIMLNQGRLSAQTLMLTGGAERLIKISNRAVVDAMIFIATLPILLVYPFIQRHFISGIRLGALKE